LKQRHFIDIHKGITALAILGMIAIYNQWDNPTAWVYLALHCTYGVLWVLKSRVFPDQTWEQKCSIWYGLYIWAGLSLYWAAPLIITSQSVQVSAWYTAICISMYVLGVFLHFATDMQKHTALRLQPESLITDGLLKKSINMNYFGELLIYLGFGLLAYHWIPLVVLGLFIGIIWFPNMRRKAKSLSRYAEYTAYRKSANYFIPFLF